MAAEFLLEHTTVTKVMYQAKLMNIYNPQLT
jgi:hypothetical protein